MTDLIFKVLLLVVIFRYYVALAQEKISKIY